MKYNTIIEVISSLLILLFVYAALSKLFEFNSFKYQIHQSPFISNFSDAVWLIPLLELMISAMLIFNTCRLIGLYSSFFLMLGFTIYIGSMLAFVKHRPCSCGGILRRLSWSQHFIFNISILILALLGIILQKKYLSENIVEQQFKRDAS